MTRRILTIALAAGLLAGLAACESSQDKSKRLEKNGAKLEQEKGLEVSEENRDVKVSATTTLQDENGTAVVVSMRNGSTQPLAQVPVLVDLAGANGKSVYTNATPGLDVSLVRVPLLEPGAEFEWINDQVAAPGKPGRLTVKIGAADPPAARLKPMEIKDTSLRTDPVDGVQAIGQVVNPNPVEQKRLIIFVVGRKGGKIVAAGRSIIERLRPNKPTRFFTFFIGNPTGAKLSYAAPPTTLK